jgi:transposase
MMRAGLYRPVHVKTLRSQKLRMLLTHRKLLQSKAIAIEDDLRATSHNFGLKVGVVGAARFEAQGRPCSTSFSNPMMEGPWRRFRREARAREQHRHRSDG